MVEQIAFWVGKARNANRVAVNHERRGWTAHADSGYTNRDTYMRAARTAKAKHQESLVSPF